MNQTFVWPAQNSCLVNTYIYRSVAICWYKHCHLSQTVHTVSVPVAYFTCFAGNEKAKYVPLTSFPVESKYNHHTRIYLLESDWKTRNGVHGNCSYKVYF